MRDLIKFFLPFVDIYFLFHSRANALRYGQGTQKKRISLHRPLQFYDLIMIMNPTECGYETQTKKKHFYAQLFLSRSTQPFVRRKS